MTEDTQQFIMDIRPAFEILHIEPDNDKRGSGKTYRSVLFSMGQASLGKKVVHLTPTHRAMEQAASMARNFLPTNSDGVTVTRTKVSFPNGGYVDFRCLTGTARSFYRGNREDVLVLDLPHVT